MFSFMLTITSMTADILILWIFSITYLQEKWEPIWWMWCDRENSWSAISGSQGIGVLCTNLPGLITRSSALTFMFFKKKLGYMLLLSSFTPHHRWHEFCVYHRSYIRSFPLESLLLILFVYLLVFVNVPLSGEVPVYAKILEILELQSVYIGFCWTWTS